MVDQPDKNAPATFGDLNNVLGEMALRFDGVDAELKGIRGETQEMRGDIDELRGEMQRGHKAILNIVTSIDAQLRELKTLPARVERLERSRR